MKTEFQAVVLAAGRGTRFPEITGGSTPKCLLPVGNFPLVYYPLNMLQQHGIQDIILVVLESQKDKIQQRLEKTPLKLKIEYVTLPNDSDYGTADSLGFIAEKIKTDVILVSCDTITDASLYPLINQFREKDASVVALFIPPSNHSVVHPCSKNKNKPEKDLVGINEKNQRLVFLASASDFEENVKLPAHLLRSNREVLITTNLTDAHIYIMKKWIVEYLAETQACSTIKGELLPFIVRKQMSRTPNVHEIGKISSEANVNIKMGNIFNYINHDGLEEKILEASLYREVHSKTTYYNNLIRCYATIAPKDTFGLRVNTILGYCVAYQKVIAQWEKFFAAKHVLPPLISSTSNIKSTQIVQCSAGDNTTIAEKTSLKNSCIGANCVIHPKSRIIDSLLMNNVVVEEGCVIENSIICDKVKLEAGSFVKKCLVGPMVVVKGTREEDVHLTESDYFMEIE